MGGSVNIRVLGWVLALVATSALAEDVTYNGRTLDVAADQDARPIRRVLGSHYAISLAPDEIINKAQSCLTAQAGIHVESSDPSAGQLVATTKFDYRARFSSYSVKSRLQLQAANGGFQITETEVAVATLGSGEAVDFRPLTQKESGWEKSLDALILGENALVDCLYR